MYKRILYGLMLATFLVSCSNYSPKPYAYFRIDLPENEYIVEKSIDIPAVMNISKYANAVPQTAANNIEKYIDFVYPQYQARIYCSYVEVNNNFRKLSEDSRTLVYKHSVRADAIIERPFENKEEKVYGILYELTGNSASPIQFVLTDSVHHFLRGALYFNSTPNADSISPVSAFIEKDLKHLVETIKWKN